VTTLGYFDARFTCELMTLDAQADGFDFTSDQIVDLYLTLQPAHGMSTRELSRLRRYVERFAATQDTLEWIK
jgi:hypothetical protein